ncbi:MAG: nucleotidyltransferase domain-containing protein [Planctomycetes bacterium]|nr:nucleotidyltransferase domain-containing protein [Planctomycetota bacterium]MBU4397937.1 nucleotidyltransferase domain-containing protein [Planctomycetota bacterium]MCG2683970.1 nucleotidyltransferase domain-containing protein [Planctomycetales bacterium]
MDRNLLLQRIKDVLQPAFGDRFRGVVLYGSEARGTAGADSDVDVLVLLTGPIQVGKDISATTRAIYPLMLEMDRIIDATPADIHHYEDELAPLYRNAKREGIRA